MSSSEQERAVVLLSGGLDSCVALAEAINRKLRVHALHISYGQRSESVEQYRASKIVEFYGPHCIRDYVRVDASYISHLCNRSALFQAGDLAPSGASLEAGYVPFRNAQFLSIAVAMAENLKAHFVYAGGIKDDVMPDNSQLFYNGFQHLIHCAKVKVTLITPLLYLTKEEVWRRGVALAAPVSMTWSCYNSGPEPCGQCKACKSREGLGS